MLNIFVCEDDAVQRKSIVQIIKNTVLIEELDMQLILDTPNPYELLETVKTSQNTGIYFLDIDLKCDMNGMKLAQQIRLYDPRCFIIFVTSHSELSYMTFQYRVEAMDFVLKDNPAEAKVKILHLSDMLRRLILCDDPHISSDASIVKAIVWKLHDGIKPVILYEIPTDLRLS